MRDIYIRLKDRVKERIPSGDYVLCGAGDLNARRKAVLRAAREVVWEEGLVLNPSEMQSILGKLLDEVFGLGPLESLLRDEEITEIMVNGPDRVFVEREGRIHATSITLDGQEEIHRIIDRIIGPLGLHVDEASPYVDARLPDGSRVNVVLPPLSLLGPVITIRKFRRRPYTMAELVASGTLHDLQSALLAAGVRDKKNLVISGGAGTGKTTLLNALSAYIGEGERVITLEDAAELRLQQPHVLPLESRPPNLEGRGEVTLRDLLRNALRMRPDRIIIGEVRGPEALDLLQALNTGHKGSITTIHANSPSDALSRLETMALTAGIGLPSRAIRDQVVRAVDILVHMERDAAGKRRVSEITFMDRNGGVEPRLLAASKGDGAGPERGPRLQELAASFAGQAYTGKGVGAAGPAAPL